MITEKDYYYQMCKLHETFIKFSQKDLERGIKETTARLTTIKDLMSNFLHTGGSDERQAVALLAESTSNKLKAMNKFKRKYFNQNQND